MSRIQQILEKAEREGRTRHTTTGVPPASAETSTTRVVIIPPGAPVAPPAAAPSPTAPVAAPAAVAAPAVRPPAVPNPMAAPARTAEARLNPLLVAALQPHSPAAEQYRALRTRIAQSEHVRDYRALVVTSASAGDGKSVTAFNLALAMAQEFHRRVLLIDADLRRPSLHTLTGLPDRPGLSDVLTGTATLEDVMVNLPAYRLTVIPAGSPVDRPTELLGSAEMRRIVDLLRSQFDRILFDTPPAAPLADVGVLSPLADGVLLVVRAGHTQRPAIDRALEDLDPSRLLGLVLNDVMEPILDAGYEEPADADGSAGPRRSRGVLTRAR